MNTGRSSRSDMTSRNGMSAIGRVTDITAVPCDWSISDGIPKPAASGASGAAARTSSTASPIASSSGTCARPRTVRCARWWTCCSASTAPASTFVPPRSTPITQSAAMSATIHGPMADDPGRREGAGGPSGPPEYKLYRSRPRWFKAPGRAGEPGFDELRESRRADREGRPRKPITPGRVVKWVAIAIGVWIGLSLVLFLISAQIEQSNVSDQAKSALDGGFPLTSGSNILVLGSDARPGKARDCTTSGCGAPRSDTIMLMRVGAGHSARLPIPRDTIVAIPGHGRDKINAAYAIGGPALTITTVKDYLGIKVNHLVEVNFNNFPEFIDALGGIDFTGGCVISNISGGKAHRGSTPRPPPGAHPPHRREAPDLP